MRIFGMISFFAAACGSGEVEYTHGGGDADSDADTDGDADTDSDADADSDADTDAGKYEIAIGGTWVDSLGIGNKVTDETWTWSYPPYPDTVFDITGFDNEPGVAVVHDSVPNDNGEQLWGRFDWTFVDDVPYVCHAADSATAEDVATSAPTPDRNDLTSGCRGFEWWAFYPT
jgi:hypothetical protein